ncbi:ribosomal protection-like ABC-F family protein [Tissierella sp. Yu-01]|uniref:ribosomal protection-like ABC-F family protein n=1 Tax=Tissierella sp. Yu-01 TaxID=3035694 RepID=UPI00240D5DD0|nr:ABC-F type ribosomal protection protein [Tissierella sp. Yu-01]WFA08776.1 ABC-F type ribosomal protection protein [Tissierella sp. Yu-01]
MLKLNVSNISKAYLDKEVLKNISFSINNNERIGIVGRNGCGKTTLMKIILGEISADNGFYDLKCKIGYLPQANEVDNINLAKIIDNKKISKNIRKLIGDLDLEKLKNKNISLLSGGEKTKLLFVKAVMEESELLLMDEPTNFLDWKTIEIMENFLKDYKGAILTISHDRVFLDNVVESILEINKGEIKRYSGNYSSYKEQKEKEEQRERIEYIKYKKKEKALKQAAQGIMDKANKLNATSKNDYLRGRNKKLAKKSKSMLKRLEKMQEVDKPFIEKEVYIEFDEAETTSPILISGENITKSFDRLIFKDINFQINRGRKIALLGDNGTGKSTLINIILGRADYEGSIRINSSTKIGYLSQEFEGFDFENTIIEEMKKVTDDLTLIRNTLGQLLIREDNIYKKFKQLSYGEKVRVALSKLLIQEYNMLILDEPTNFLDIPTKELIEEAIQEYNNSILYVTHDRYLVKNIANEIWELKDKKLNIYLGDYDYYMSKLLDKPEEKVDILMLEMKLADLSFRLTTVKDEEKKDLEKEYFAIARKLRESKKS